MVKHLFEDLPGILSKTDSMITANRPKVAANKKYSKIWISKGQLYF